MSSQMQFYDANNTCTCHCQHRNGTTQQTSGFHGDLMQCLPPELYLSILLRLDVRSLQNTSHTCRHWQSTIQHTDWLWRKLCYLNCDDWTMKEIMRDREMGYSWKESFIRTCSPHSIKRQWFNGAFSNLGLCGKLPPCFCPMDVETWGHILELELSR